MTRRHSAARGMLTLLLTLLLSKACIAQKIQGAHSGVLYGTDHAFGFTAPKGWVLDNQSAVSQGLHAVFYPAGLTWESSPVIAYVRAFSITKKVKTAEDLVRQTLDDFHHNMKSPDSKAKKRQPIALERPRTAKVYYYTGDTWGNEEVVAYIEEAKTINFFVLSAKDRPHLDASLKAFESLVKSYRYLSDHSRQAPKSSSLRF